MLRVDRYSRVDLWRTLIVEWRHLTVGFEAMIIKITLPVRWLCVDFTSTLRNRLQRVVAEIKSWGVNEGVWRAIEWI